MKTDCTSMARASSVGGSRSPASQRGYVVITLAMIGLLVGSAVSAATLSQSTSALVRHSGRSPAADTISAVEHALWRIRYDAAFVNSLSGEPPAANYQLDLPGGAAEITVTASAEMPEVTGLTAELTVDPGIVPPNTPSTVTFTFTVTNFDNVTHQISRVDINPIVFTPAYLTGSTTGFTTSDPVYEAGRWRWTISPAASVPAWGGEVSMSFQMVVNEGAGNYWTGASASILNVGTVQAPMPGTIRVVTLGNLDIVTTAAPWLVIAGTQQDFSYDVTVTNIGASSQSLKWIKHFTARTFANVSGSTSGVTTNDPQRNHDVINDRWEWTWSLSPSPVLGPGESATLHTHFTAALSPGLHTSVSAVRTREDREATGQTATATTGETAPITSINAFTIHVDHPDGTSDVLTTMTVNGVDIVYWIER